MNRPDALLVIYDQETGDVVNTVVLTMRPILADTEDAVVLALELPFGGVTVQPEWVGKEIVLEVSPSAATQDRMTAEIVQAARRFEVPVG